MRLRVNGGMGKLSLLAVLLMPNASLGAQDGAIDSYSSSTTRPRLDQINQATSQAANLSGQRLGKGF